MPLILLTHFAGASNEAVDVPTILHRLIGELGDRFGFHREVPNNPIGLASAFANALGRSATRGRVVLVLDGLDAIDRRAQGVDLAWLPDPVPVGVRLVVSAAPGSVFDLLARRGWSVLELAPIDREGRRAFAASYLRENHHKKVDPGPLDAVAAVEAGANARHLRTFLDELVAAARGIEDLSTLIGHYAAASDLEGLFDLMLNRLEAEHGRSWSGLVPEALALLWASRDGLSDSEARELLGSRGESLPAWEWVPLRHAIRPFTTAWSGLVRLQSPPLRQAVERRYLSSPGRLTRAHRRLALYFDARPVSTRVVQELPWHLARLGAWSKLAERLARPSFLAAAWPVHRFELRSYWATIETRTPLRMVDALAGMVDAPAAAALAAAQLLADAGRRAEALRLARGIVVAVGEHEPSTELAALDLAASLALEAGDLAASQALSERQAVLAGSADDPVARITPLARLAAISRRLARVETSRAAEHERAALADLDEAERLAEASGADDLVADLLGQRIRWHESKGEVAKALGICSRRALLSRQMGDLAGLQDALAQRGRLLARLRKSSAALGALDESEALARRLRDPSALQSVLGDRADVLTDRRRLDEALQAIEERERICSDELGDPCALAIALLQKAVLFGEVMKRTAIGLDLVDRAEALADRSGCAEALDRASAVRAAVLAAPLRGRA
jgi:hypothetical protein